jgi:hypothetical protein
MSEAKQDYTNRGILGKNLRRQADTHPTHSGHINIDGKEFWLSGWVREGDDGSRYFALSVKPKEARRDGAPKPDTKAAIAKPDFDDDISF